MKTPAAAPTAAPLTSPVIFSVSSALASAISSRTSSDAFSLTSWTALPSSDVELSVMPLVDQPLEDAGEQERADEGDPGDDLGALERARVGRCRHRRGVAGRGGRGGRRVGVGAHTGGHHVGAGEVRGRRGRSGLTTEALGLGGVPAGLLGLGRGLLGALLGLALLARELLLFLVGGLGLLVRLGRLLLGAPGIGLAQLLAQLGATR